MYCPLIKSECQLDCALIVGDRDGNVACSIPAMVEVYSGSALTCQNYYTLKSEEEGSE